MYSDFRERLAKIYVNTSASDYGQPEGHDSVYRRVINFGVYGETGEKYYIFIYRDSLGKGRAIKYGAVVFFYVPHDREKPVQVFFSDTDIHPLHRNIYLYAGLYFLERGMHCTMEISGASQLLYDDIKEMIAKYFQEEEQEKQGVENYDFNVRDQEVRAKKIALSNPDRYKAVPSFNKWLWRLTEDLRPLKKKDKERKKKARMGLKLELTGDSPTFKPVIVPINKNGSYGKIKRLTNSNASKYDLDEPDPPPLLKEFANRLLQDLNEFQHIVYGQDEVVNWIYFGKLVHLLYQMPDELTFVRTGGNRKDDYPLKKIKYKKIHLKFAAQSDRETLTCAITLTTPDDRQMDAGLSYGVFTNDREHFYLVFPTGDGQYCFAAYTRPVPPEFNRLLRFLIGGRQFSVHNLPEVKKYLRKLESDSLAIDWDPIPIYELELRPIPVLKIYEKQVYSNESQYIKVDFDYNSAADLYIQENDYINRVCYANDKTFESMCFLLLKNDPLLEMEVIRSVWGGDERDERYFTFKKCNDVEWLITSGPGYLEKGFKIYSYKYGRYIGRSGSIHIDIDPGIKWLEFKPLLTGEDGETIDIEFIDLLKGTAIDKKGALHLITKKDIEKLRELAKYAQQYGDHYRVPAGNHFLINALYDARMEQFPQLKEQLLSARKLEKFKKIPNYKVSENFNGTLRPYQEAGFRWLHFLHDYNFSGCLADDMGLGKTVQTLALLHTLADNNHLNTSLLVVPVSAVLNWEMEISKFTPSLTVYRHLGVSRKKDTETWENHQLVITSYATMRNDIEMLKEFDFDYIVLDESQAIKNHTTQVSKAVKLLKSSHRLTLSGTPIENNCMELWSLFDFLMPAFLGTHLWFKKEWATPVEKHKDNSRAEQLKQMIYPFILRRKKDEVERDLPDKTEIVETLDMDEKQLKLYVETAQYYSDEVSRTIDEKGLNKSSFKILEGMLRLRQICLFPRLVNSKYKAVPSVKFDHFKEMLEDILAEGHKVLVFSQFVKVLSILKDHLDKGGVDYSYLDGSMDAKKRGKAVKRFQEGAGVDVFLLSLKAGGVAINLTAADYVVIFDPWWNPAVEAQAIDRSHRIGQTRKVIVYRMVVKNTIEEKMLELQQKKRDLVDKLVTSETTAFKDLTRDDILKLFQYS